jgi:hypothetical protein
MLPVSRVTFVRHVRRADGVPSGSAVQRLAHGIRRDLHRDPASGACHLDMRGPLHVRRPGAPRAFDGDHSMNLRCDLASFDGPNGRARL